MSVINQEFLCTFWWLPTMGGMEHPFRAIKDLTYIDCMACQTVSVSLHRVCVCTGACVCIRVCVTFLIQLFTVSSQINAFHIACRIIQENTYVGSGSRWIMIKHLCNCCSWQCADSGWGVHRTMHSSSLQGQAALLVRLRSSICTRKQPAKEAWWIKASVYLSLPALYFVSTQFSVRKQAWYPLAL